MLRICYREIREAEECVSLRTLAVNGKDLIAAGLQPGRELGDILKQLLDEVLENPEKNEKDYLISRAKELRYS